MTATPPPIAPQGPNGAFDDLFASEPMGAFDDLTPLMESVGTEMAQGWEEKAAFHTQNAVRAFADNVANIGTFAVKAGSGIGSLATGDGFGSGWEAARQQMLKDTGTTDPGLLDIFDSLGRKLGVWEGSGPTAGVRSKQVVQSRLGEAAMFSELVGATPSFMVGPGAVVGRATERVSGVVLPVISRATGVGLVSSAISRGAARFAASKVGVAKEAIEEAIKNGRAWEVLAKSPEWGWVGAIATKAMGGIESRSLRILDTTAANVAQAYAMSPDDAKMDAAFWAAVTGPLTVPVARLGQKAGSMIAAKGLSIEEAQAIKAGFDAVADGKMSLPALDKLIRENSRGSARGLAHVVSGLTEGTAFTAMDPGAYDDLRGMMAGEEGAAPRLLGRFLATAGGVVAMKGVLPSDLAPMFRTLRPDLNTLSTYLEAETNKRLAEMPAPEQEPKPLVSKMGQVDQPDAPSRNVPEMWVESNQRALKAQADAAAYEAQMRTTYGWAQGYADGPIRGGYVPEFAENGAVRLTQGRDFSMVLEKGDDTGPVLRLDPKIAQTLAAVGRPLTGYDPVAPTMVELRGAEATRTLNDLTLLAQLRQMQGAIEYQRAGMRPVPEQPGVWQDANGRFYTMQLDGTSANRTEYDGNVWRNVDDFATQGDLGPPRYDSDGLKALEDILRKKAVMVPDPLVDATIGHALTIARYGEGVGADELRQYLETTDITRIVARFRNGVDREMAFDLAALALGQNNSTQAAQEAGATQQPGAAETGDRRSLPPPEPQADLPADVGDAQMPQEQPFLMRSPRVAPLQSDPPPPQDFAGSLGAGVKEDVVRLTRTPAQKGFDFMIESRAEVLAKNIPGETAPYEVRQVISDAKTGEGRAIAKAQEARKAFRTPEGRDLIPKLRRWPWQKWDGKGARNVEGNPNAQEPAWLALAQKMVPAETPTERAIQGSMQPFGLDMYNAAREAGEVRLEQTDEGPRYRPLAKRDTSYFQRFLGKHAAKVLNNAELRRAYFNTKADINPDLMVTVVDETTGARTKRRLTGADIEKDYIEMLDARGLKTADEATATEFMRLYKNDAYLWKGPDGLVYEMLETDPIQVMTRMAAEQPWRTAAVKRWGQGNIPADARRAMLADPETPAAVRSNLEKGGVDARLQALIKSINRLHDGSRREELTQIAKDLFAEVQGASSQTPTYLTRLIRPLTGFRTAAMASKGFVPDVPEIFFRNWMYGGFRRTVEALRETASSASEAIEVAKGMGDISHEMGEWSFNEAKRFWHKAADFVGIPAAFTERIKGAVASKVAGKVIADARAGKATINDLQIAQDILRLSAEDVLSIKSGKFSKALENQWRQELVGLLTGRVRPVEGSRLASNPNITAWIPFTKWITKRTLDTVRTITSIKRVHDRLGSEKFWTSKEGWNSIGRLIAVTSGMAVTGVIGTGFAQLITGMFAGRPMEEGIEKTLNWFGRDPGMALAEGLYMSTVGGPFAQQIRVASNPDDATALAGSTHITAILHSLYKARKLFANGDTNGAVKALSYSGFIPLRSDFEMARIALFSPKAVTDAAFDAKLVREFKRKNDIQSPFGAKQRDAEFYEAISGIVNKVRVAEQNGTPIKEAVKQAMEEIRTALALAPEDSVAGAIEGHQMTKQLDDKQRTELAEWVGDVDRMNRIYDHDEALREVGAMVRKMEGTNPTEWQTQLAAVRDQAMLGASDRWGSLIDRTLDEAAQARIDGQDNSSYVDQLAETLAAFPEHLETALGEDASRRLLNPAMNTGVRARAISAIFRRRMNLRIKAERTRDAKDKAKEARGG